jgi:hypothetical protein
MNAHGLVKRVVMVVVVVVVSLGKKVSVKRSHGEKKD